MNDFLLNMPLDNLSNGQVTGTYQDGSSLVANVASGVSLVTDALFGNCLQFDGFANGYVDLGNVASLRGKVITVSFWFNPDGISGQQILVDKPDVYSISAINAALSYAIAPPWTWQSGNHSLTVGVWHQVVIVSDTSTMKAYVNGKETSSVVHSGHLPLPKADPKLILGGRLNADGVHSAFSGKMAALKIYDKSLSAEAISESYDGGERLHLTVDVNSGAPADASVYQHAITTPGTVIGTEDELLGNTLMFEGNTADYVDLGNPAALQIGGSQTISFFVKRLASDTRQSLYAQVLTSGEENIALETDGTLSYNSVTTDGTTDFTQVLKTTRPLMEGNWNHVALVRDFDNQTLTCVLNGKPDNQIALEGTSAVAGTQPTFVGKGNTANFQGQLLHFRVYAKALSEAAISDTFQLDSVSTFDEGVLATIANANQELIEVDFGSFINFFKGFDFTDEAALATLKAMPAGDGFGIDPFLALQRILRLTDGVASFSLLSAFLLMMNESNRTQSAMQIADLGSSDFVRRYANVFIPGALSAEKQARWVHKTAVARKSKALHTFTALKQQTEPHFGSSRVNNLSQATRDALQDAFAPSEEINPIMADEPPAGAVSNVPVLMNSEPLAPIEPEPAMRESLEADKTNPLPSYEKLFGDLNFCQCSECRSVLSPAAYFVDLMRATDRYVQAIETDGLLVDMPLRGNLQTSETSPVDFDYKRSGTPTYVENHLGLANTALKLDNTHYLESKDTIDKGNNFTLALWTKITTIGSIDAPLFSSDTGYFAFAVDAVTKNLILYYDGGQKNIKSSEPVPINTWTHISMTVEGKDNGDAIVSFYINGQPSGSETITQNWQPGIISLGGIGTIYEFEGAISNVLIYNQTLSTTQIDEIYNPINLLIKRRPDLMALSLDCANTNTIIPKLDIVNGILETHAEKALSEELFADPDDSTNNPPPALPVPEANFPFAGNLDDTINGSSVLWNQVSGTTEYKQNRYYQNNAALVLNQLQLETQFIVNKGSEFTFACWVNISNVLTSDVLVLGTDASDFSLKIAQSTRKPVLDAGNGVIVEASGTVSDGWTHLALTATNQGNTNGQSTVTFYIDGEAAGNQVITKDWADQKLVIDNQSLSNPGTPCLMSNLEIYDHTLSATEVYGITSDFSSAVLEASFPFHNSIAEAGGGGNIAFEVQNAPHALFTTNHKGEDNYALDFDGSYQLETTGIVEKGSNFTFACWVKANELGNVDGVLISSPELGANYFSFAIGKANSHLVLYHQGTGPQSDDTIEPGVWNHIALTASYDSGNASVITFYINGKPSGTHTVNTAWVDGRLSVGGSGDTYGLNGAMSDLWIYDRTLTAEAIQVLAGGVYPALAAQATYPFNEPFDLPFTRIQTYLDKVGLSPVKLQRVIDSNANVAAKDAQTSLGLSPEAWSLLKTPVTDASLLAGYYGVSDLTKLYNVDTFMQQTGLSYAQLLELVNQDLSEEEIAAGLQKDFFINIGNIGPVTLATNSTNNTSTLANLNATNLDHINRFVRLANVLGFSFTELDWALRAIAMASQVNVPVIDDNALLILFYIKELKEQKGISVETAATFVGNIKTFGNKANLLAEVYQRANTPTISNKGAAVYADNAGNFDLTWKAGETDEQSTQMQNSLAASLKMSHANLLTIARSIIAAKELSNNELPLTLDNLSLLYRFGQLPQALGLSADDFLLALTLQANYKDGITNLELLTQNSPDVLHFTNNAFIPLINWLKEAGVFVPQLAYLLTGSSNNPAIDNQRLGTDAVQNFLSDLEDHIQPVLFTKAVYDDAIKSVNLTKHETDVVWYDLNQAVEDGLHMYLDAQGIITQQHPTEEEVKTTIGEGTSTIVTADNPTADQLATVIAKAFAHYYQLQQKALSHQLGSLLAVSEKAIPWVEQWVAMATGDISSADVREVTEGIHATEPAAVILLQILLGAIQTPNDKHPDSSETFIEMATTRLLSLEQHATLVSTFRLSAADVKSMVLQPILFGFSYPSEKKAAAIFFRENLQTMFWFKKLVHTFRDQENKFLGLLDWVFKANNFNPDEFADRISEITAWDVNEVKQYMLTPNLSVNNPVAFLYRLNQYFLLGAELSLAVSNVNYLHQLPNNVGTYANREKAANILWSGLQTKYKDQAEVLTALTNEVNEAKRDALVPYVIHYLNLQNARDLYEYLLIDVEVEGIVPASKVKSAISTVQLYLYRVLNHLEQGVNIDPELHTVWAWMSHYRVWQANREVFLYPENYIEPDLRKEKTPEFADLESALQQGNLTDPATVEAAFKGYMDAFMEVATLDIAGSSARIYDTSDRPDLDYKRDLCLVGKTKNTPAKYYYRVAAFEKPSGGATNVKWNSWLPISTHLQPVGGVSPVFAFGKWFVFWVEIKQSSNTVKADSSGAANGSKGFEATINYAYLDFNGKWTAPHEFTKVALPNTVTTKEEAEKAPYVEVAVRGKDGFDAGTTGMTTLDMIWLQYNNAVLNYGMGADLEPVVIKNNFFGDLIPTDMDINENWLAVNCAIPETGETKTYQSKVYLYPNVNGSYLDSTPVITETIDWKIDNTPFKINISGDKKVNQSIAIDNDLMILTHGDRLKVFRYNKVNRSWDARKFDSTQDNDWVIPFLGGNTNLPNQIVNVSFKEGVFAVGAAPNDTTKPSYIQLLLFENAAADVTQFRKDLDAKLLGFALQVAGNETILLTLEEAAGNAMSLVKYTYTNNGNPDKQIIAGITLNRVNTNYRPSIEWNEDNLVIADGTHYNYCLFSGGDEVVLKNAVSYPNGTPINETVVLKENQVFVTQNTRTQVFEYLYRIQNQKLTLQYSNEVFPNASQTNLYATVVGKGVMSTFSIWKTNTNAEPFVGLFAFPVILSDFEYSLGKVPNTNDWSIQHQNGKAVLEDSSDPNKPQSFSLTTTTEVTSALSTRLFEGGISELLSIDSQRIGEKSYAYKENGESYTTYGLDFFGVNGAYYWEIFFHAPFLIAKSLQKQQQFETAQQWLQYVFNPTVSSANWDLLPGEETNDKYWRFLGLRTDFNAVLQQELNEPWSKEIQSDFANPQQLTDYHDDPFDPQVIATLRPVAYQKAMVMNYIDNLIQWGDNLFREYTIESIGEATMLYVEAYDILGKKPVSMGACDLPQIMDLSDLLQNTAPDGMLDTLSEFLILLESTQNAAPVAIAGVTPQNFIADAYFCLPENEQFISYWSTVEQRLYNIRHELNIDGVQQNLALFQPPINPMDLVAAVAQGEGIGEALSNLQVAFPYYRFDYLTAKAREATQLVTQLGQSLLAALEKNDAEALSLLYNTHQQNILSLTGVSRQEQIDQAGQSLTALEASLQTATDRLSHYTGLINDGLSGGEKAQIVLESTTLAIQALAEDMTGLSAIAYIIPTIFGFSDGGSDPGEAVESGARATQTASDILRTSAGLAGLVAGFDRRDQDWTLQQTLAQGEIDQMNAQITAAQTQQRIAQQELVILQKNLDQEQKVETFMKSKFTNQQLYQWLTGKTSALYFQAYQLAYELCTTAQKALQFELGISQSFIQPGYWNNLHHGLMSGEGLQLALQRMENTYTKQNKRKFEIVKHVALKDLMPKSSNPAKTDTNALETLKDNGTVTFELTNADFGNDYANHTFRQIKSVSLSFPAVLGAYQTIHATLTQVNNTIDLPDGSKATDYRANQQVALSQGLNDTGMFELNFNDPRYLPFEGTGAASTWKLEIPADTNPALQESGSDKLDKLTDVIMTIRYTALPGGSGQ